MTLFDGPNAGYAQELYEQYARNPDSVPAAWRRIFEEAGAAVSSGLMIPEALSGNGERFLGPAAIPRPVPPVSGAPSASDDGAAGAPGTRSASASAVATEAIEDTRLLSLVARATAFAQAYRDHGHELATTDPLGSEPPGHPQLDPAFFGTTMEELAQIPASVVFDGAARAESLAEALKRLEDVYGHTMGFQFEHLEDPDKVLWLWEEVESGRHHLPLTDQEKIDVLERLSQVEGFEQFLHRSYLGQKRFSIEGTDMLVPMIDLAIELSAAAGAREVMVGMAHRGRLNVLTHVLGVPYEDILGAFEGGEGGALDVPSPLTGDVKYHMGASHEQSLPTGRTVRVRLAPNPSHLEFVNPVINGMARAEQFSGTGVEDWRDPESVVPVVIHGDASFAAEGVVAETLNLARLRGYSTGGTLHIIVNNQIGFTTTPRDGRSTRYSSDVAKGYDVPVIHVNADDPEACLSAVRVAMAYRARFHDDVLIDLIGYRRHGHNEGDEPAYTQPRAYAVIRDHATVRTLWAERLLAEGTITDEGVESIQQRVTEALRAAQDRARQGAVGTLDSEGSITTGIDEVVETAVSFETLERINRVAYSWPEPFHVHPKLKRQLDRRREGFSPEAELDWAYAETLAFGSILEEGVPIRMTGQDSQRGTFSQRHLVLHDHETGDEYAPLSSMGGARFEIYNSPLTETAVLGFEYGYSVAVDDLVLWEAQFGDFVNVAQVMIDQFVSSGRSKWSQESRLVMLLPHGYEGQGPEHSSARVERFLQLAAEDNMVVTYPTTPAQYFHLLRRQARRVVERPLIVLTPKSLLRLPAASSTARELTEGEFRPVIDDGAVADASSVRRIVLCSGKFFYDLSGSELRSQTDAVALCRVEELYPFPGEELEALVERYPQVEEVIWAQEEPRNMGALSYIGPRLRMAVPRSLPLRHVSRPERSSPAEGRADAHAAEQARLITEALQAGT